NLKKAGKNPSHESLGECFSNRETTAFGAPKEWRGSHVRVLPIAWKPADKWAEEVSSRMLGVHQETPPPPSSAIPRKEHLLSTAMKRTNEWIYSQEVPSDIEVKVGGSSFPLHKFLLVSKCGYIRKLVSEVNHPTTSAIEIPDVPGGAEAFELVTKYCYGINFEITTENIAMLRCAAEYLEMTEDSTVGSLVSRAEAYLEEVALLSLSAAVTVLHKSEELLPVSEKVKLVSRCIDAVAYMACNDSQLCSSSRTDNFQEGFSSSSQPNAIVDWWAEELTVLRIDTFQRTLMAMKARGFKQYDLGPVIMLYAQKSLRGLDIFGRGRKKMDPKDEHEKRVILETVLLRMRMQLKEVEKPPVQIPSAQKPPLPKKSFINSLSKKLGRLYPFTHTDSVKPFSGKGRTKPPKDRRHSIS
ncbi:hypothetical protein BHM03_00020564, partial [Ensete ventricosum]